MFKKLLLLGLLAFAQSAIAQMTIDQNGIRTTVVGPIATGENPNSYLLAEVGYNSFHWQAGGAIIIELLSHNYSTSYLRYVVEIGSGRGTMGSTPLVSLREIYGFYQSAKVDLGTPVNLGTTYLEHDNFSIPIYLDLRYYSSYKVRITYMQDRVNQLTGPNQIKIYDAPIGSATNDFSAPQVDVDIASTGNLQLGNPSGSHYLMGNVGVGTTTPQEKLSVNGKIRAKEIKVEMENWPDYVFKPDYQAMTLPEIAKFIKTKGHLPEVPSAAQVQKEGIALGEMNKLLLKKIEELTLFLIDQHQKIQEQDVLINRLLAKDQGKKL